MRERIILAFLKYKKGSCSFSGIVLDLRVSKATVSRYVSKLVEGGYVIKRESGKDGRTIVVDLTEKGMGVDTSMIDSREFDRKFNDRAREEAESDSESGFDDNAIKVSSGSSVISSIERESLDDEFEKSVERESKVGIVDIDDRFKQGMRDIDEIIDEIKDSVLEVKGSILEVKGVFGKQEKLQNDLIGELSGKIVELGSKLFANQKTIGMMTEAILKLNERVVNLEMVLAKLVKK